jgi:hypothetical protein
MRGEKIWSDLAGFVQNNDSHYPRALHSGKRQRGFSSLARKPVTRDADDGWQGGLPTLMELELYNLTHPPPPPSYEQCVAPKRVPRAADYTVTPLAMAALLAWDDDED